MPCLLGRMRSTTATARCVRDVPKNWPSPCHVNPSVLTFALRARRPLHHNAHALRNVDYMVDEDELVRMSRSAPPCDGESDLGQQLPDSLLHHPC